MKQAKAQKKRVDFIALHCYQDFSDADAVSDLKKQLTEIYETYQLPLWITEFGNIDTWAWDETKEGKLNPKCTETAGRNYFTKAAAMLEGLGFVERYAWFLDGYREGESVPREAAHTLLYTDGGITNLGVDFSMVQTTVALRIEETPLADGKLGKAYSAQLKACGGTGDYVFSATPPVGVKKRYSLPKGLSVSPSGQLYGTPEYDGMLTVCVSVTDGNGQTTFRLFTLIVE